MTSDNSQLNAEDKAIALKYKNLNESLKDALRIEDKSDPMYIHAQALYDIITSQLIEVTRKIYDEREQKQNESSKKP